MKTVRSCFFSSLSAFPDKGAGRHLHRYFRGLSNVHSHYNLHARRIADTILYTEGSNDLVTYAAASVASGWSEPVPARDGSR